MDSGEGTHNDQPGESWDMNPSTDIEQTPEDEQALDGAEQPQEQKGEEAPDSGVGPAVNERGWIRVMMCDGSWDWVPPVPEGEDPVDFYCGEGYMIAGLPGLPDPRYPDDRH